MFKTAAACLFFVCSTANAQVDFCPNCPTSAPRIVNTLPAPAAPVLRPAAGRVVEVIAAPAVATVRLWQARPRLLRRVCQRVHNRRMRRLERRGRILGFRARSRCGCR